MTATQTKLRNGTKTQCEAMTPVSAEVIIDTTKNRPRVGDGTRVGGFECPNFSDTQLNAFTAADAGGTADAITVTLATQPLAWTAYLSGMFKAASASTSTAPTLAITGLAGTKTIKKKGAGGKTALDAGDIQAGVIYRWVYDGTDVQLESVDIAPPSGLKKLGTKTFSAASNVDLTSYITAGYSEFHFVLDDVTFSVDGAGMEMLTSADNGSSFATAAGSYAYKWDAKQLDNNSSGSVSSNSNTLIPLTETGTGGAVCSVGNAASEGLSGKIIGRSLTGTARRKIFDIDLSGQNASGTSWVIKGSAVRLATAAVNALRLRPTSGTITGKIHVFALAG